MRLIAKDFINAKIDALEGVVRTTQIDKRTETFQKVNELCDRLADSVDGIIAKAIVIQVCFESVSFYQSLILGSILHGY